MACLTTKRAACGFAPSTACCRCRQPADGVLMTDRIEATSTKRPVQRTSRIDGRRLRSERTKQLIIEAYLSLAHEHSPQAPTAAEIAHRAGYSVRSVFERFPDLHTLQVAAVDYAMVQVAALAPARDGDGDRQTR